METRKDTQNAKVKEYVRQTDANGYVHAREFAKAVAPRNGTMDKS